MKEKYVRWASDGSLNNFKTPLQNTRVDESLGHLPENVPTWTSARYCLAYLAFLGFFNVYALRVNMSVAIISMANSTDDKTNTSNECHRSPTNKTSTSSGEFNWTSDQKALLLGAFFYGYICTQILGGYLAGRFGGKYLFGGGILCTTIFTLLTPVAARTDFKLLIATRVIEGFGEGVTFPAMHELYGVWCPPLDRSKLVSMGYAGAQFGTVIAQPVSGILCASNFLGGWPSVFYVFGTIALIWCLLWFLLAYNRPVDHPRITDAELRYIESTVTQQQSTHIPWLAIFTSRHVWAIACAHFANNWGFYTLLTCLPLYLKNVLGFDISQNGLVSALPYFVMWIMINVSGFIADNLRERGIFNTTQTRKVFNSIGLLGPTAFLIGAGYVNCDRTLAVSLICLATAFNGFTFSGFNSNHIDIASRYAGILMGITNTVATIPGFVSPLVVSALTGDHGTSKEWRYVFFIAGGVYILGTVLFVLLATGKEQDWNSSFKSPFVKTEDATEVKRSLLGHMDTEHSEEDNLVASGSNINKSDSRHPMNPGTSRQVEDPMIT